jgi:nitrate reductase gamma subunit
MRAALHADSALSTGRKDELYALMQKLETGDPLRNESEFVELFDRGRSTSLHLFEHVHGDSRDRGPAMIDLIKTYEQAGLYLAPGELPDYLPVMLEFASTQTPQIARAFLGEMAHLLNAIFNALQQRKSPYASVLGALLELAGEQARAVRSSPTKPSTRPGKSRPCSTAARRRAKRKSGQAQPIHFRQKRSVRPESFRRCTQRSLPMKTLDTFLFGLYPYICLSVFLLGSLIRFDRDQYTWKSDSSQLLKAGQLRWGSNLFHVGVLFLFFGHFAGMLTPHFVYEPFITAGQKQVLAMTAGGIAGTLAFIGVTILLHRRLSEPRIRATSKTSDIVLLVLLWLQLALGLASVPLSAQHLDGSVMMLLAEWAQRIVTFRPGAAELLAGVSWVFKAHIVLGMSIFLIFPFTRLAHVWSGFGTVGYLVRPYQVVRSRRLNVPAGHNQPRQPGASV